MSQIVFGKLNKLMLGYTRYEVSFIYIIIVASTGVLMLRLDYRHDILKIGKRQYKFLNLRTKGHDYIFDSRHGLSDK